MKKAEILIDDDFRVHNWWKEDAEFFGQSVKCFRSIEDFLSQSHQFDKESNIYVDINLGAVDGAVESFKIGKLGFSNIYLLSTSLLEKTPEWIKGHLLQKTPPWSDF